MLHPVTSFIELQFPAGISYGSSGGPSFSTDIVASFSGHEQRNINRFTAICKYNVATGIKTEQQWQELIEFFRARCGRAVGFRYKDWSDYKAVNMLIDRAARGKRQYQLRKYYHSGTANYMRIINKPVNNSFCKIYLDGVRQAENYNINFTTGIISFDQPPQVGAAIRADFEFDVPVRFDTDYLDLSLDSFGLSSWNNITLIEIRI